MKGLIIKDFLTVRSSMKTTAFFIVFYVFLGFFTNNFSMISTILIILLAMLPITALAYDERAKFNFYALTMPILKADIVLAKYVFGFLLLAIGGLISIIPSIFVQNSIPWLDKMLIIFYSVAVGTAFQALILPIMFKFGAEKGRIYMIIAFFFPTALIVFLAQSPLWNILIGFLTNLSFLSILSTILVAIILFYILSVIISLRIVNKNGFAR